MTLYEILVDSGVEGRMDLTAPAAREILQVCMDDLAEFLIGKNKAYGNSALEPLRAVSKADPAEQIRVRIDDKLSRLVRGQAGGEDALKDLVGYWVLLRVLERRGGKPAKEGRRCRWCAGPFAGQGFPCSMTSGQDVRNCEPGGIRSGEDD